MLAEYESLKRYKKEVSFVTALDDYLDYQPNAW